jgi:hypothetical protein
MVALRVTLPKTDYSRKILKISSFNFISFPFAARINRTKPHWAAVKSVNPIGQLARVELHQVNSNFKKLRSWEQPTWIRAPSHQKDTIGSI